METSKQAQVPPNNARVLMLRTLGEEEDATLADLTIVAGSRKVMFFNRGECCGVLEGDRELMKQLLPKLLDYIAHARKEEREARLN